MSIRGFVDRRRKSLSAHHFRVLRCSCRAPVRALSDFKFVGALPMPSSRDLQIARADAML
jgi:hypothetical protein